MEFEIPCHLNFARIAGQKIRSFLLENGCLDQEASDCELAVVEACNNAVRYASGASCELCIQLTAECRPEGIEIQITDHTCGLEWPRNVALPDSRAERGRGIYLIQQLMDSTSYRKGQTANRLTLRKRRATASRASPELLGFSPD